LRCIAESITHVPVFLLPACSGNRCRQADVATTAAARRAAVKLMWQQQLLQGALPSS
jgi:hypothetical protein